MDRSHWKFLGTHYGFSYFITSAGHYYLNLRVERNCVSGYRFQKRVWSLRWDGKRFANAAEMTNLMVKARQKVTRLARSEKFTPRKRYISASEVEHTGVLIERFDEGRLFLRKSGAEWVNFIFMAVDGQRFHVSWNGDRFANDSNLIKLQKRPAILEMIERSLLSQSPQRAAK